MLANRQENYKHTGTIPMEIMKLYQDEYHLVWYKLEVALQKEFFKKLLLII